MESLTLPDSQKDEGAFSRQSLFIWWDWPLRFKGFIVIILPLASILIGGLLGAISERNNQEAQKWVNHTLDVQNAIARVVNALVEAESSTRGYLLTSSPAFQADASADLRRVHTSLKHLKVLVADNAEQTRHAEAVALEIRQFESVLTKSIRDRQSLRSAFVPASVQPLRNDVLRGKAEMDDVFAATSKMSATQERLKAERLAWVQRSHDQTRLIAMVAMIMGIGGGLVANLLFSNGVVRRVHDIEQSAYALVKGEALKQPLEGKDELAQLAHTLYVTSQLLQEQKKELRATYDRLQAIFDNVQEAILIADDQGHCISANAAASTLTGYTHESLLRMSVLDLTPVSRQASSKENWARFIQGGGRGGRGGESLLKLRDGSEITVEYSGVSHIRPGQHLVVLRDVTERRQIETSMKEAQAEAERANLAKSEFLSRMSHELRTPLNAILGFAQVLEMDELSTEQQTSVGHILRGGEHLLGLINEVLDIARIEAGQMSLSTEPVQLSSIFQEAVAMVQPLTSGRQVQLHMSHIEEPPDNCFVRADRQRLKQVLLNLLSNAIKYNRHGGEVHLDWEEAADGQIIITVRDTGQGIAPDKMSKLFTPFDRLGAEQSNIEGTGIGLALSKRLVELMSGTLEATSVFGEGSTFRVTLPRAVDPAESVAELDLRSGQQVAHEQPKSAIVWTVLYIEDNLPNLQLVEQILMRRSDINLHSAMQGSIGLELALQHQPDLILLDLHLPDMHGEEVLSRLRQDDALRNTPVIVISADATPRQIARLKEAGVVDYLTKPLNVRRFLQLLDEILKV